MLLAQCGISTALPQAVPCISRDCRRSAHRVVEMGYFQLVFDIDQEGISLWFSPAEACMVPFLVELRASIL